MASAKATEWTPSKLAVELKMDRRTLGRKLTGLKPHREDARGQYYWLRDVLDHLLKKDQDGPDLIEEQALLAEARRMKLEEETKLLKGETCRVEYVERLWAETITNARNRLRALPHNTAHRVIASKKFSDAVRIIEDAVDDVLRELGGTGIPVTTAQVEPDSEPELDAAAENDGKRVGRPRKKAKPRSKRGTRKLANG